MALDSAAMNFDAAKQTRAFYLYIILFHLLDLRITTGTYFELIAGKDEWKGDGNKAAIIRKDFFQCGRDKSCTHVMKFANGYKLVNDSIEFEKRKKEAVFIYERIKLIGKTLQFCHIF